MKPYVHWSQVQEQLRKHAAETGELYSFFDALKDLWAESKCFFAEETPRVSFENWDIRDMDELARLLGETPVHMEHFQSYFHEGRTAQTAAHNMVNRKLNPIPIADHQAMGTHVHDAFEIEFVVKGTARLTLNTSSVPMTEGMVALISPELSHDFLVDEGSIAICMALPNQTIEQTLFHLLQSDNVLSNFFRNSLKGGPSSYLLFHLPNPNMVLPTLRGILHESYMMQEYCIQTSYDYLEILMAQMLRYCGGSYKRHDTEGATPMLAVLRYIQDNFRTVSLQDVANRFHYEPSYLGKQIKLYSGKNYTAIVNELRISEAKRLLVQTDLSIEEVGHQAGFESLVHFSRTFKRNVGMSPSQYRN